MEIIDLSILITNGMGVPGENDDGYSDPEVRIEPWVTLDTKAFAVTEINMGSHTGTHCDVSSHVVRNGKTISDYDISTWVGWAHILDFTGYKEITAENIIPYKRTLETDKNLIPILKNSPTDFFTSEARDIIIACKPKAIIMGKGMNQDGIEDTLNYLRADIPMIMQADHNALKLVEDGDLIVALPLKIQGTEAAPIRLIAVKGLIER